MILKNTAENINTKFRPNSCFLLFIVLFISFFPTAAVDASSGKGAVTISLEEAYRKAEPNVKYQRKDTKALEDESLAQSPQKVENVNKVAIPAEKVEREIYASPRNIPDVLRQKILRAEYLEKYIADVVSVMRRKNLAVQNNRITKESLQAAAKENAKRELDRVRAQRRSSMIVYDLDFDGAVTKAEVIKYLSDKQFRGKSQKVIEGRAKQIMQSDLNKDGTISYREMSTISSAQKARIEKLKGKPTLQHQYFQLDPNKDGTLTIDELKRLAHKAFYTIDSNGDNMISPEEKSVISPQKRNQTRTQRRTAAFTKIPYAVDCSEREIFAKYYRGGGRLYKLKDNLLTRATYEQHQKQTKNASQADWGPRLNMHFAFDEETTVCSQVGRYEEYREMHSFGIKDPLSRVPKGMDISNTTLSYIQLRQNLLSITIDDFPKHHGASSAEKRIKNKKRLLITSFMEADNAKKGQTVRSVTEGKKVSGYRIDRRKGYKGNNAYFGKALFYSGTGPEVMECFPPTYKIKNQRFKWQDALNEYDYCRFHMLSDKKDQYIIVNLGGSRVRTVNKEPQFSIVREKVQKILNKYEVKDGSQDVAKAHKFLGDKHDDQLLKGDAGSPIIAAAALGREDLVKQILKKRGFDDQDGLNKALVELFVSDKRKDRSTTYRIAKMLLDAGARFPNEESDGLCEKMKTCRGEQLLCHAAQKDDYKSVQLLLKAGVDIHEIFDGGSTALHCAVKGRKKIDIGVIKVLLSAGVDPNIKDKYQMQFIHHVPEKHKRVLETWMRQNSIEHTPQTLNKERLLHIIKYRSYISDELPLALFPKELRNDSDILESLIAYEYGYIQNVLPFLEENELLNKKTVLLLLSYRPNDARDIMEYLPKVLRNDEDILRAAVRAAGFVYNFRTSNVSTLIKLSKVAPEKELAQRYEIDLNKLKKAMKEQDAHFPVSLSTPHLVKDEVLRPILLRPCWQCTFPHFLNEKMSKEAWLAKRTLSSHKHPLRAFHYRLFYDQFFMLSIIDPHPKSFAYVPEKMKRIPLFLKRVKDTRQLRDKPVEGELTKTKVENLIWSGGYPKDEYQKIRTSARVAKKRALKKKKKEHSSNTRYISVSELPSVFKKKLARTTDDGFKKAMQKYYDAFKNKDGAITAESIQKYEKKYYGRIHSGTHSQVFRNDLNKDGKVTRKEAEELFRTKLVERAKNAIALHSAKRSVSKDIITNEMQQKYVRGVIDRFDTNKDGAVTEQEIKSLKIPKNLQMDTKDIIRTYLALDPNNDNKITQDEHNIIVKDVITSIDLDRDGSFSSEELHNYIRNKK